MIAALTWLVVILVWGIALYAAFSRFTYDPYAHKRNPLDGEDDGGP